MRMVVFGVLALIFSVSPGWAKLEVLKKEPMSYVDCLSKIRGMSSQLEQKPTTVEETDVLRTVRFEGVGTSFLITCSKDDRTMLIQKSSAD